MQAGKLRHRVEIQESSPSANSYGEDVLTWTTTTTRWASIEPVNGREGVAADQVKAQATHKIRMRWIALTPANRLKFGTRIFDINTVLNPEEVNRELEILATEAL